jgi:hypothetical protein
MLSEVLREHDSFFHYIGIRGIQRFPLDVKWTKCLGTVKFQVLSLTSYLLSRLPVLVDDLSQKLCRVSLYLNLMSCNQEPMALQLLMVTVRVRVIHQLSRGWWLHVLIKE